MAAAPALIFGPGRHPGGHLPGPSGRYQCRPGRSGPAPAGPGNLRHMVGFGATALITQAMQASGTPVTAEELPPLIA